MKVLIADDHPTIRRLVRRALSLEPEMEVVGEAGDGEQAVDLAEELHPDVVIMDYLMPNVDGLAATIRIKERHPEIAVLAYTSAADPALERAFQDAGADGMLSKDTGIDHLIDRVRHAEPNSGRQRS